MTIISRSKKCILRIPPEIESIFYAVIFYLKHLAQLGQTSRDAAHRYHSICELIPALLFWRGPSAISGLIIAFLIWPSVQGFSDRGFSHISQKVDERIHPSFAHAYSLPSIGSVLGMLWIHASLEHVVPRVVSPRCRFFTTHITVPMNYLGFGNCIGPQATTRLGATSHQISCSNTHVISAIASAFAKTSDLGIHEKSSKTESDGRMFCRHNGGSFTVLFSSGQTETHSECPLRFSQKTAQSQRKWLQ